MPTNKAIPNTVEGIYDDIRKLFGVQFNEFVNQFIKVSKESDLDSFFDDAAKNEEFLDNKINTWCEKQDATMEDDLDAVAAIFVMAFIEAADKATVVEVAGETVEPNPLGSR